MLSDLLRSWLLNDKHDRYKLAGMLNDLLRSGLPHNESYLILQTQSESMLSDLLRSGLLKDRHDRYKSAGMLSDLLRSGLPNEESYLILQIQSESMLSDLLRSGLLKDRHNWEKVDGYVERPLEKRATLTLFTPDHHMYSLKNNGILSILSGHKYYNILHRNIHNLHNHYIIERV